MNPNAPRFPKSNKACADAVRFNHSQTAKDAWAEIKVGIYRSHLHSDQQMPIADQDRPLGWQETGQA